MALSSACRPSGDSKIKLGLVSTHRARELTVGREGYGRDMSKRDGTVIAHQELALGAPVQVIAGRANQRVLMPPLPQG